jgi:hypothetical protein
MRETKTIVERGYSFFIAVVMRKVILRLNLRLHGTLFRNIGMVIY